MKLHIIFGQRKCSYDGEFAPEALDIADEFTVDQNPVWLDLRLSEHRKDASFSAVEVLIVRVPSKAVIELLAPKAPEVEGTVTAL